MSELTADYVLAEFFDSEEFTELTAPTRMAKEALQRLTDAGFEVRSVWPATVTPHERGVAAAQENLREAWAALAMIRETIETLAPSGTLKASEYLDGPTFMHEADELVAGIVALAAVSRADGGGK
jgi:hypothetical protein